MEFFGVMAFTLAMMAFVFSMFSLGLSTKVKRLNSRLKKLEKQKSYKGEYDMSKLIQNLVHTRCTIILEDELASAVYEILDLDDDWVKLSRSLRKGKTEIRLVRIDSIKELRPEV
ncbi:hypothetical protein [Streptococcus sobrinus]|uniref:hypothetical protein n=1 Tax=Streptococcus sobrinus TaxID=1310 RepID=UPI0003701E4B|nr:hypothetical protein [Streptococcus sobrinus]